MWQLPLTPPRMASARTDWWRHLSRRRESPKTIWKLRLALTSALLVSLGAIVLFWIASLARNLACEEQLQPTDAILVENFDTSNYLVFERAGELRRAGMAPKVFVPATAGAGLGEVNLVSAGFVDVLARAARLPESPQMIPIHEVEPISLNAAYQIRTVLRRDGVRSVLLVTPGFRSRRSLLVYSTVFGDAGIATWCVPVFGRDTPDNWTSTWHGIQEVAQQYGKLQYYRFYVLPRLKHETE